VAASTSRRFLIFQTQFFLEEIGVKVKISIRFMLLNIGNFRTTGKKAAILERSGDIHLVSLIGV
jgi:hypothetical protein